jgi:hypothetical protein
MVRQPVIPRIYELTQDQWGLVTRRQLTDAGIGSTTVERLALPGGILERVAWGVYRITGAPIPDHQELRAAWLQLDPEIPAWQRDASQGVVSHRSAASLYELGELPADQHEFTAATRRQSRRPDVRIHILAISGEETAVVRGLPTTRPPRIVADLLRDHEDPEAVARIVAEAIHRGGTPAAAFTKGLAPHAVSFGFQRGDGQAVLRWLLELSGNHDSNDSIRSIVEDARDNPTRTGST